MSLATRQMPQDADPARKRRRIALDNEQSDSEDVVLTASNIQVHKVNFDEAIRMATDNKITTSNSWKYALIDYFHDMKLLRGQDGLSINFEKAGATLDGCMKIFSHRIDSVASATGQLLSGLSGRAAVRGMGDAEDQEDDEGDDDYETAEIAARKRRKTKKKQSTLTLVPEFSKIRVKHYEKDLDIDPLFTRALADFDEGGSKSLLMNILKTDSHSKVVFDETISRSAEGRSVVNATAEEVVPRENPDGLFDVGALLRAHPIVCQGRAVCAQLRDLEGVLQNIQLAGKFVDKVLPMEDEEEEDGVEEMGEDVGFEDDLGQQEVSHAPSLPELEPPRSDSESESDLPESEAFAIVEKVGRQAEKAWDGPRNLAWKVRQFKRTMGKQMKDELHKEEESRDAKVVKNEAGQLVQAKKKAAKKKAEIDFLGEDEDEAVLFKTPRRPPAYPESWFNRKDEVTQPEDLQWKTSRLLCSFLKPDTKLSAGAFKRVKKRVEAEITAESEPEEAAQQQDLERQDQQMWASAFNEAGDAVDVNEEGQSGDTTGENAADEDEGLYNDIDFNMQLAADSEKPHEEKQLKYAKVSKKVDVRLLKENMWESAQSGAGEDGHIRLTDIVEKTLGKYSHKQGKDISTSFYFICMLHLANEHGLEIEGNAAHTDMTITM